MNSDKEEKEEFPWKPPFTLQDGYLQKVEAAAKILGVSTLWLREKIEEDQE